MLLSWKWFILFVCLTNIFLPSSLDWPHISNSSVMTSAISESSIVPEYICCVESDVSDKLFPFTSQTQWSSLLYLLRLFKARRLLQSRLYSGLGTFSSLTRPILVVHLEGPPQLLLGRPAGRHVRGHHELLERQQAFTQASLSQPTLKSILPLPSLSKILKIWSTKTLALPAGRIMEYISRILSLLSCPSGQSCLNPLESH